MSSPLARRLTCTVPEMAEALGIGRDAAYAAVEAGELPSLRVGRRLLVPVPKLLDLLGASSAWRGGPALSQVEYRQEDHPESTCPECERLDDILSLPEREDFLLVARVRWCDHEDAWPFALELHTRRREVGQLAFIQHQADLKAKS